MAFYDDRKRYIIWLEANIPHEPSTANFKELKYNCMKLFGFSDRLLKKTLDDLIELGKIREVSEGFYSKIVKKTEKKRKKSVKK